MMKALTLLALVAYTLARPKSSYSDEDLGLFPASVNTQSRQAANPTTPNQVTDALLVCVEANLSYVNMPFPLQ